jgi:molecular chaperone GrpE
MEEDKRVSSDAAEEPSNVLPNEEELPEDKPAADVATQPKDTAAMLAQEELAKLKAEMEALRAENDELKDRSLRLVAEMENIRRRTERDKLDYSKYAISEFARDVLSVADNMRRAIEAVPKNSISPAVSSLIEGVEVTERELLKVLERYKVTRFDPLGEPFNPHLHDAMTRVDMANVPADTVVQVIHAGYMIDERVLRPAAVIVAKGGGAVDQMPKPAAEIIPDIPLGAMKIPTEVVSSAGMEPAAHYDPAATVFGRQLGGGRRTSIADEAVGERMPPRRSRPPNAGHDARHGGAKPTSLHKPIISKHE